MYCWAVELITLSHVHLNATLNNDCLSIFYYSTILWDLYVTDYDFEQENYWSNLKEFIQLANLPLFNRVFISNTVPVRSLGHDMNYIL
jgi:hypothetical protein